MGGAVLPNPFGDSDLQHLVPEVPYFLEEKRFLLYW